MKTNQDTFAKVCEVADTGMVDLPAWPGLALARPLPREVGEITALSVARIQAFFHLNTFQNCEDKLTIIIMQPITVEISAPTATNLGMCK